MKCASLKEFVTAVREFKEKHPKSAFVVKDVPQYLQMGLEAIVDKSVGDEEVREWSLPISKLKMEGPDVLTKNEHDAIQKFFHLRVEYNQAEKDYINALTGGEKYWDLGDTKFSTKGADNAQALREALATLTKLAKTMDDK